MAAIFCHFFAIVCLATSTAITRNARKPMAARLCETFYDLIFGPLTDYFFNLFLVNSIHPPFYIFFF